MVLVTVYEEVALRQYTVLVKAAVVVTTGYWVLVKVAVVVVAG